MSCAAAWSVTPCEGAWVNDKPHLPMGQAMHIRMCWLFYANSGKIAVYIDLDVMYMEDLTQAQKLFLVYLPKTQNQNQTESQKNYYTEMHI